MSRTVSPMPPQRRRAPEAWHTRFIDRAQERLRGGTSTIDLRGRKNSSSAKPTALPIHESKTYHTLSNLYDCIFTPLLSKRIRATISSLNIPPGARILDVGVGTGASLPAYPPHAQVTGIDLSEEMLRHAREKVVQNHWAHIHLQQMDALNLNFQDHSFDYVMAFHVAAVVPDCGRLMREINRVCKPGGTIVIINHLRGEGRWSSRLLDVLDPLTHRLGWQTHLRYEDLVDAAPMRVVRRFKTSPSSLFTVIIAQQFSGEGGASGR